MQARMSGDHSGVTSAKTVLGETGPVWWDDDAADVSGLPPTATPYADWWASLTDAERDAGQ